MLGLPQRPHAAICLASRESLGRAIIFSLAPASAAWPEANLAIYVPFRLQVAARVRQLGSFNGGTAADNLDVGIYTAGGERLLSTGSIAQSGTNALQSVNVTDTDLPPGNYYLAMAMDGTTGTNLRLNSIAAEHQRLYGVLQESSAFPLPAAATFVAPANAYVPYAFAQFGRMP